MNPVLTSDRTQHIRIQFSPSRKNKLQGLASALNQGGNPFNGI